MCVCVTSHLQLKSFVMPCHRPSAVQVTNDQLWKLTALASFEIMISNLIISNMIRKISNLIA